jgi:hypothetical protein
MSETILFYGKRMGFFWFFFLIFLDFGLWSQYVFFRFLLNHLKIIREQNLESRNY